MPRQLADWIESYVEYTTHTEAPLSFHFWTSISVIGAALRRKVYFNQVHWRWFPNFYIMFVGPPGIPTKSTTLNIGLRLINEIQGIKFGPNAITWQMLTQSLASAREDVLMPDGLMHPMCCLTFAASELGTLLDPQDRRMIDILVDLWDANDVKWQKATKTAGIDDIPNPWVNIIACTTPSWITDNMPKAMVGGGFTSRCVFIYEDKKRQFLAYPKRHMKAGWIDPLRSKLIHDLEQIAIMKGEFEMTEEAYKLGEKWYEQHWKTRQEGQTDDQFEGYMARKQGHIHKLAMAISAARKDEMVITAEELRRAIDVMTGTEGNIPLVFERLNTTPEMDLTMRIIETVQTNGKISTGALYRTFSRQLNWPDFCRAVDSAIMGGYVTKEVSINNTAYLIPIAKGDKASA